ncbi:MAG: glycine cleavage system protein GcvH [Elusimicrobia bacterium]|nr:glycine cleavage system protein GcvH [Elusimicrobiota bacterium]
MANPNSCKFAKTHEWVSLNGNEAVVGISDHAQHEITDVVFVELPKIGRKVKQGEAVAVVESVKAAFDIYAPISGEISAVNESLVKDPSLVNQSPYDQGWFFKIKPSNPTEANNLMDHSKYQEFVKTTSH